MSMAIRKERVVPRKDTLWHQVRINKASYLLMAPYFILFFLFTVLPVLMSVYLSFNYFNMLEAPRWVGWANYIKLLLEDDIFIEFKPRVRAFLTLVFYAPSICGNAYMIWNLILTGDRYGYLNGILLRMGFLNEPILWMQTEKFVMPVLIVVQLWLSLGTGFLSFIAGLQTVDKGLYEAAAIDGVKNRWQELWFVTLPAMKPQLMFGAVMQITQSFAVADISIALAGNPSVNYSGATIVTHLLDYGSTRLDMGYASAIATILFLLMVGTNKLVQRILRRVGE